MKTISAILLMMAALVFSESARAFTVDEDTYAKLKDLDLIINRHEEFAKEKEHEIYKIKVEGLKNLTTRQQFELNERIFNEYLAFNADSALKYANLNLQLANSLNDKELRIRANMKIAFAYSSSGQLNGAMDVLREISQKDVPKDLKMEYFGQLCNIYARLAEFSDKRDDMRADYYNKEFMYADSALSYMPSDHEYFLVYRGWRDQRQGKITSLIDDLEQHFTSNKDNNFINSQLLYLLANLYKHIDRKKYLDYLIQNAEMDIRIANTDSRAFADLANELFRLGDTKNAYKYMTYGMDLALKANNRVRMVSMMEDMNTIQQENFMLQKSSNKKLRLSILCLVAMALLLIVAIVLIVIQFRKLQARRENEMRLNDELNKANSRLHDTNVKLHESNINLSDTVSEVTLMHQAVQASKVQVDELNAKLAVANKALQEQNAMKEEYIGYVLLLCSDYISKLDDYRKNIRKKVNAGKFDELRGFTDTPILMQKEIKEFHKNFDAIVQHVFPKFVDDVNSLLQPDQRFVLKDNHSLNTDLRIFALMHLGVTDSGKIADFLHISLQTVYNSRLKTRGKAIRRDTFDADIQNIGK